MLAEIVRHHKDARHKLPIHRVRTSSGINLLFQIGKFRRVSLIAARVIRLVAILIKLGRTASAFRFGHGVEIVHFSYGKRMTFGISRHRNAKLIVRKFISDKFH